MKPLIYITCGIAAGAGFLFFTGTVSFLLKEPDFTPRDIVELCIGSGLFLTAWSAATAIWARKKTALWYWLPVFVFSAPLVLVWTYETTKMPETMEFATEEDAATRTNTGLFVRPTRAEFDQNQREQRFVYLGLISTLIFQTGALMFLRRKGVLS